MPTLTTDAAELTEQQFNTISNLVKDLCGINLHDGKKELVKARLNKRLRTLGLSDFTQYIAHVQSSNGSDELLAMLDALSTNLTFFFREVSHFDLLSKVGIPEMMSRHQSDRKLRIWSAGCSSGEEPYSLGIVLKQGVGDLLTWDVRILATDLSTRMLEVARRGVYGRERFRETPPAVIHEHFAPVPGHETGTYRVKDTIQRMVSFARLNLMESWPMKGPFDAIFCRNVMIYFDKPTQARLVERFWNLLAPGGLLFIGHSESLAGARHRFQYIEPTVYRKV